ncbi:MAG: enoyl-CoA hydratase [Rhizobiales bacterium]|nr:enoyl-CoA hydratase [Hyphomicrobiales bacterium]
MPDKTIENGTESQPAVLSRLVDGVLELTLNRPKQRNSLSLAMIGELQRTIDLAADDRQTRVIVLAAEGPVFCAGHDLKELTAHRSDPDGGREFFAQTMRLCARLMQTVVRSPKPVVAAVHATATAAGCQLVASCDLAVAARSASFCTPGVNIGLFCSTPMVALSRNVSRKRAMEMLLLGEMISAEDAVDWGLVNRVVDDGGARDAAFAMARRIASKSAATVKIGKEAFYRQVEMPLGNAYDFAADVMVRNMMEHDAAEGIEAFIGKRAPIWRD